MHEPFQEDIHDTSTDPRHMVQVRANVISSNLVYLHASTKQIGNAIDDPERRKVEIQAGPADPHLAMAIAARFNKRQQGSVSLIYARQCARASLLHALDEACTGNQ